MNPILRRILWVAAALVVVAALAIPKLTAKDERGGPGGGGRPGGPGGPRGGGRGNDTLNVTTYVVQPVNMTNYVTTTGILRANEAVELSPEASGKLIQISFREGASVARGQLLAEINSSDLRAQLKRTEYRLALAKTREQRQRNIKDRGGVSQEEYDETVNEVNVLEAEIEVINAQIAKTRVLAPFSGVIGLRNVSEGAFVSPQTKIATLQSIDPIKIDFAIAEKYSGQVRIGSTISFTVEGTDQVYNARIFALEPRITEGTRMLQIRALSPNPGHRLVPGRVADVKLVLAQLNSTLAVPAISVVPEQGVKKVFVVEDGKAASREIQAGFRTDSSVQVLNGLAPGDTVITSAILQLRPGSPIRVGKVNGREVGRKATPPAGGAVERKGNQAPGREMERKKG